MTLEQIHEAFRMIAGGRINAPAPVQLMELLASIPDPADQKAEPVAENQDEVIQSKRRKR